MFKDHKKKWWAVFSLFIGVGFYNAMVINTDSSLSAQDVVFVKGLDEMYGVSKPGRTIAARREWKKLSPGEVKKVDSAIVIASNHNEQPSVAAIQDDLSLNLIEVVNMKKWKQGLTRDEFYGSLVTNEGVMDSFSVYLPSGDEISVSFVEMNGNVFNYDLNGEIYNAMIFQADQTSYMVTLTDGPLEGTRMRFANGLTPEQQQMELVLAEDHNIQVGHFSESTAATPAQGMIEQEIHIGLEAQSFNLDPQVL